MGIIAEGLATDPEAVEWFGSAVERLRRIPMEEIGAAGIISWAFGLVAVATARYGDTIDRDDLIELNRRVHEECFRRGIIIAPAMTIDATEEACDDRR